MILKQYVEVHVYLDHFIDMWHSKKLIQTRSPLCLFETFDYFEIGMDRIDSGCKMVFFLQGLEMNWFE